MAISVPNAVLESQLGIQVGTPLRLAGGGVWASDGLLYDCIICVLLHTFGSSLYVARARYIVDGRAAPRDRQSYCIVASGLAVAGN